MRPNTTLISLPRLALDQARRLAAAYLAVQAVAGIAWWGLLFARPGLRSLFRPASAGDAWLLGFLPADALLFVGGSALAAVLLARRSPLGGRVTDVVAGGVAYSALVCAGHSALTGEAWAATLSMGAAAAGTALCAILPRVRRPFRVAPERPRVPHLARTAAQILVFWGVTLAAFPLAIAHAEAAAGAPRLALPGGRILGGSLFALASALGLASAWVMARRGEGTPLPLDSARRLVVSGPYAWIRNPMATSGIAQGIGVALMLASPGGVLYALLGAVAWQRIARPLEEADLLARFGPAYAAYRERVPCWWPRTCSFRPEPEPGYAGAPTPARARS